MKIKIFFIIFSTSKFLFANPLYPGGDLTHLNTARGAFNTAAPNNSVDSNQAFGVGNAFFRSSWVIAPASAEGRDGLGPTYNAISCASCHVQDGRGFGYIGEKGKEKINLSLLFRLSQKTDDDKISDHPDYGDQFNPLAINGVPGEGDVSVFFTYQIGSFDDGSIYELRKPTFIFRNLTFTPFDHNTLISPRVAPHMIGLGLIESINQSDILSKVDPEDLDMDGVTGKANYIWDINASKLQLGRFGWKANQPSLLQQNASAFLGDIGLTTSLHPNQNCPLIQIECSQAISGGTPEISDRILERVTTYTQTLGVPIRRDLNLNEINEGEKIFHRIGCASCHTPSYTTGNDHQVETLRRQIIYPYSDFLLHDMGDELADHRPDGFANGKEWRTPPLWGLGLFKTVSKHQNLLHDARARGVEEAILWHGGEGSTARNNYKKINKTERSNLVQFVNSL